MTSEQQEIFDRFAICYGPEAGETGPERFVREVLKVEPDKWQIEVLRAFGRGERHISIRSCHGVGKTAVIAWCVLLMLLFRFPQKTIATAPTKGQLEDALVAEVIMWLRKLPEVLQELYEVKKNRIELRAAPESSFFSAATAREENPEALQGKHSAHVLLIADEASGVAEAVFEAASGSMAGPTCTTMLAGNPVRTSGLFFDTHNRLQGSWFTVHVTGVLKPNHDTRRDGYYSPRPGAAFIQELADTYGEGSNAYRVRGLGEFPLGDLDTVIPYELVVTAQHRNIIIPATADEVWGLDCARFGDDDNVLVRRNRLSMNSRITVWQGRNLMQSVGRLKAAYDQAQIKPSAICVDVIGLGAGIADRGREIGLPIIDVNVSETQGVDEQYRNLRTELWYRVKEWLDGRNVVLPRECTCELCRPKGAIRSIRDNHVVRMVVELLAQRSDYTSAGKIICFPKKEMKKRLKGRSPNIADALVLTFATEPASLMGSHGSTDSHPLNKPLHRGRSVV
jgi:phage terminase large subunit